MTNLPNDWQLVVGLEVHVELLTKTKLFSSSPNRFGDEPNINIDPVTLGLPGALPVLNRQAVELAMRIGMALNCRIQPCTFHRKNYFYPDLPKAYQITQYDQPLNVDGFLELPGKVRIGIERAHLEEDTGKSTHFGGSSGRIHGSDYSLIDFNRAGVPLVEIVSRPDIRSAEQAKQYVAELRSILLAVGASDAKMEEGSMRCDVNVSVHRAGTEFGTRCEIKNINSIRSVGRAIEYEARRQIDVLESGGVIQQQTRHWDDASGRTETLRTKEDADDYRYFLEPDLVPVAPDLEWIDRVRAALPVLPAARRFALAELCNVEQDSEAIIVVVERGQDDFVSHVVAKGANPQKALTYVQQSFAEMGSSPQVSEDQFANLVNLELENKITSTQAKLLLIDLIAKPETDVRALAKARGFETLGSGETEKLVKAAIAEQPEAWEKYCRGEVRALGALVGAAMKASQGKADGKVITRLLEEMKPADVRIT